MQKRGEKSETNFNAPITQVQNGLENGQPVSGLPWSPALPSLAAHTPALNDCHGDPRHDVKRECLSCQCSFFWGLSSTKFLPSCLGFSKLQRADERPSVRPGLQKTPGAPNAFVFREPCTSSKLWGQGSGLGLGVGWDMANDCPVYCVYESPGGLLCLARCCGSSWPSSQQPPSSRRIKFDSKSQVHSDVDSGPFAIFQLFSHFVIKTVGLELEVSSTGRELEKSECECNKLSNNNNKSNSYWVYYVPGTVPSLFHILLC